MWVKRSEWDRVNRELARLIEAKGTNDRDYLSLRGDFQKLSSLVNRLIGQLSLISSMAMGSQATPDKMFDPEEMLFLERLSSGGANIAEATSANDK